MTEVGTGSWIDPSFELAATVRIGRNCSLIGSGRIEDDVTLGDCSIIDGSVQIGARTRIGHHVVIQGQTYIGTDNIVHSFCSLGQCAQYPEMPSVVGALRIGDSNVIREFTTLHASTTQTATLVGNECYIMAYSHVGHDCSLGNKIKMANNATLAGYVCIGDNTYLGMHSVVHQRLVIGSDCMIGMNATILKNVPPFAVVFDGAFQKINHRGLELRGFDLSEINIIKQWYEGNLPENVSFRSKNVIEGFYRRLGEQPTYKLAPTQDE